MDEQSWYRRGYSSSCGDRRDRKAGMGGISQQLYSESGFGTEMGSLGATIIEKDGKTAVIFFEKQEEDSVL